MDNQNVDPRALLSAQAIRNVETGGDYTKRGQSGEYGAYQFTPGTWAAAAPKYGVTVPLEQADRITQNKVAVNRINDWIKNGQAKNVGEIASMWNAGEHAPQAYLQNHKGVNSYGVAYDTPAYAQKVAQTYQQLKGQQGAAPTSSPNQDIQSQKELLKAQGQPVSTEADRVTPTVGGSIVRGLLKTPARVLTNVAQLGEGLTGNKITEPFSGGYLGKVSALGESNAPNAGTPWQQFWQPVKQGVGAGLELGSYAIGGGEAKAGLTAAEAGLKAVQPIGTQVLKGLGEGAAIGATGGVGQALSDNKGLGETLISGAEGGILGGLTGGVLGGVGSAISKAKGITGDTINMVKDSLSKDYQASLGETITGRKILSEQGQGLNDSIAAGILPDVRDGLYDTTNAIDKLQEMMDKLGKARGEDIGAQNRPIDTNVFKQKIVDNINQYIQDPLEKQKVLGTVEKWFAALGKEPVDLQKLNSLQIDAGKLAKFKNQTDASIRNAYRSIYHGIGNTINDSVKDTGGMNKEINTLLSKYHGIMDFLEKIDGKKIKDSAVVDILSGHFARTAGTAAGGAFGGGAGAVVASEAVPAIAKIVRKIFGRDMSSYQKVMDAILSGEEGKIASILKKVEQNKGKSAARAIEQALKETPQLPAGKGGNDIPGLLTKNKEYEREQGILRMKENINKKPSAAIELPAEGQKLQAPKKKTPKITKFEDLYPPANELPTIPFGKKAVPKGKVPQKGLPVIR